ncbi:unnamed protein product [Blepharisma stoltei]|uniref:ODAD1 central coiled coil region domain-containing protein n=1 Tax=Blepharisma stoltei TaxID=1481888 RepID=A0AAU9K403_9CILI|nr:unnamed protein product [Blepharisma stoltei]
MKTQKTKDSFFKEPEIDRLQRNLELIIQKLEREKREHAYLDEQIKIVEVELNEKKNLKRLPELKDKNLHKNILALERKLELEIVHYNEACSENNLLKNQIEVHRNDLLNYKQSLENLKGDILNVSVQGAKRNSQWKENIEEDQLFRERISVLRSKSANAKTRYSNKINSLASIIREERNNKLKGLGIIKDVFEFRNSKPADSLELSSMLRKLVKKWQKALKERKILLEGYKKNIKLIKLAFREIQAATGYGNIDDIVTAFIKSEEQIHEVWQYINTLNGEIDNLEENLKEATEKIESYEKNKEKGEVKCIENKNYLDKRKQSMELKVIKKGQKFEEVQAEITKLLPIVKKMSNLCQSTTLPIQLTTSYVDSINFESLTEDNILPILGQIEEYLSYILISVAYHKNDKHPVLKPIALDILQEKSFAITPTSISNIFDFKDLYEDEEIDDSRAPLPLYELKEKAKFILETKTSASSRGLLSGLRSRTPKHLPCITD